MKTPVNRQTVDLGGYPDLIVIYLGMRVNSFRGLRTLLRTGAMIGAAVAAKPEGLLLHENFLMSLFPPHAGMRQYWRDFGSLERWARTLPHQDWWKNFLRDPGGTGFWHETYFMRGGMEAVYDDLPAPLGFMKFAPLQPARGRMFSARRRLNIKEAAPAPGGLSEQELYE
ncbi:MAG: monooxygenase family protein [Candidatus Binataceae bacterium]